MNIVQKLSRVSVSAIVETDAGEFRVWPSGAIDFWNESMSDWGYFDEHKYSEDEVKALREEARRAIGEYMNKGVV